MNRLVEGFKLIVRISGTDLNGSQKIAYGLSAINGIGINFGRALAKLAKIDPNTQIGMLTEEEIQRIESIINSTENLKIPSFMFNRQKDLETGLNKHLYGADLAIRKKMDISFMRSIKSWKGVRHSLGLKVRGQKTRTTGRFGKSVGVSKRAIQQKKM